MYRTKQVLVIVGLLVLGAFHVNADRLAVPAWATPAPENKDSEEVQKLKKARAEAAKATYEARWEEYKVGRGFLEPVCDWSRRWLEAERDMSTKKEEQLAALEAHLKRLKELEEMVTASFEAGRTAIGNVTAARYHRIEAELWLAQAKGK